MGLPKQHLLISHECTQEGNKKPYRVLIFKKTKPLSHSFVNRFIFVLSYIRIEFLTTICRG